MDDVLPDLKTLEFLEARWRESTSYEQAEIAQAMYTFLLERGVVTDVTSDDELELLDQFREEPDDVETNPVAVNGALPQVEANRQGQV